MVAGAECFVRGRKKEASPSVEHCPKCRKPLSAHDARQQYCSVACRRSAEFEIRRLNRALESIEAELLRAKFNLVPLVPTTAGEVERLTMAKQELEARLNVLLEASDAKPTGA